MRFVPGYSIVHPRCASEYSINVMAQAPQRNNIPEYLGVTYAQYGEEFHLKETIECLKKKKKKKDVTRK
jgi:hypothetical protein